MVNLLRFAPFRVKLEAQRESQKCLRRETAQTAKPLEGLHCRLLHLLHFYTANPTQSDGVREMISGHKGAEKREAYLPAPSRPKTLCLKISVPRNRPLHLRISSSRRYYKAKVVFGQPKPYLQPYAMTCQRMQKKWQIVPARTKRCHTMCAYGRDFQR